MRRGVSSFAFGWAVQDARGAFSETTLLAFARRHGVQVVQLGDNLPVHEMSPERLATLIESAADAGIELEFGAAGLTEEHLRTYLLLCARCGVSLLRFVADAEGYAPSPNELTALLRNGLPELETAGVSLALENHDRHGAATLRGIIEAVGSPRVGICLDTANSLGAGEGLGYVSEILAPLTLNLHVKDVAIRRLPHKMGFLIEGRPLGEGQLHIAETIRRVAAAGRCRSVILEGWTPPAGEIEDTLRREHASAEAGIILLETLLREG